MGNEASVHEAEYDDAAAAKETAHVLETKHHAVPDFLPPMVLMVEALLWKQRKEFANYEDIFYVALLDGREVGRATSYPSPPVRVAPCTSSSIVTLRFFAGTDADGFVTRKGAFDFQRVGEITLPVNKLLKYGAPLYTSMWLGLSAEGSMTLDVKDALMTARSPEVPKALVTLLKPSHERPKLSRDLGSQLPGIQPDIFAAVAQHDDEGLHFCLGPAGKNGKVSTEQQVQGLVEALRIANQTARAWQHAIFNPAMALAADAESGKIKVEKAQDELDATSVASSTIHAELEAKFASAVAEIERLRNVGAQQQQMRNELELARTELQRLLSTEQSHQEELQRNLIQSQQREQALVDENGTLQRFNTELRQEYAAITQKVEDATREALMLREEKQHRDKALRESQQEHGALQVAYRVLMEEQEILKQENAMHAGMQEEELKERFAALHKQVDSMKVEKDNSVRLQDALQKQVDLTMFEKEKVVKLQAVVASLQKEVDSTKVEKQNSVRLQGEVAVLQKFVDSMKVETANSVTLQTEIAALQKQVNSANLEKQEEKKTSLMLQARVRELEDLQKELTQQDLLRNAESVPLAIHKVLQERLDQAEIATKREQLEKDLADRGQKEAEEAARRAQHEKEEAELRQKKAEEDRSADQELLKAKLAQVDDILATRLKEQEERVPVEEYESLQMKCKEVEQARELLIAQLLGRTQDLEEAEQARERSNAQVERLLGRIQDLEEREQKMQSVAHERPVQRSSQPGVSIEEFELVEKQLAQLQANVGDFELEKKQLLQLVDAAQQEAAKGVSIEDYEALQMKLETLEMVSSKAPHASVPLQDYEALQAKLELLEGERDATLQARLEQMERTLELANSSREKASAREQELTLQLCEAEREMMIARNQRDDSSAELLLLREKQQELSETRRAADVLQQERQLQEQAMMQKVDSLQQELSAVLQQLDEVKSENRLLECRQNTSEMDMPMSATLPHRRSSSPLRTADMDMPRSGSMSHRRNSNAEPNKSASEEVIRREGEKTMMGAKVSELRLAMKKKEAAHKDDIAKLNRELMLLRSLNSQEKLRCSDLASQVDILQEQNDGLSETIRVNADQEQLEQAMRDVQDAQIEISRFKGEIEVLRAREQQWKSMAQNQGAGAPQAVPNGNTDRRDSIESISKGSTAPNSNCDSYIMRLFHRLLWERFSHLDPDDLSKALKMEQRSNNMPKADVEKVLKMYTKHRQTFTMAKAFRSIDVHRTGRLAAHEFELKLTQMLSLDVEVSGYIYRLLHSILHPSSDNASSSCAAVETDSGSLTPQRLDSSKSIEEGMITEEQFIHILESRRYSL